MHKITINGISFHYTVKYSRRRKTIQLKLVSIDKLEIIVPARCTNSQIENLLRTKSTWILKQYARIKAADENPANQSIEAGALLLLLGRTYKLALKQTTKTRPWIAVDCEQIAAYLPKNFNSDIGLTLVLKQWYIDYSAKVLHERTEFWANKLGAFPKRICIREQKTRWGSCSSLGTINYNWRIIMAGPDIVDYLVIHELCHLKIPNHSRQYWQLIAQYCPNYQQSRRWLQDNACLLSKAFT